MLNYKEFYNIGSVSNVNANVLAPVLILYFDNSLWTGSYNTKGAQFLLQYEFAVNVSPNFWSYQKLGVDFRHYIPMFLNSSFANRFVFASIWGRDAYHQPFYLVGTDAIRGYVYNTVSDIFTGVNMALIKFEYRFPFIDALRFGWPLPVVIRGLAGVFFWDFGATWDNAAKTRFAYVANDTLYFDSIKSGLGIGLRLNLYYFKLMYDYATPFTGNDVLTFDKWRSYFSIGYDF
jgi:outer membrane protein assembly factor BamA